MGDLQYQEKITSLNLNINHLYESVELSSCVSAAGQVVRLLQMQLPYWVELYRRLQLFQTHKAAQQKAPLSWQVVQVPYLPQAAPYYQQQQAQQQLALTQSSSNGSQVVAHAAAAAAQPEPSPTADSPDDGPTNPEISNKPQTTRMSENADEEAVHSEETEPPAKEEAPPSSPPPTKKRTPLSHRRFRRSPLKLRSPLKKKDSNVADKPPLFPSNQRKKRWADYGSDDDIDWSANELDDEKKEAIENTRPRTDAQCENHKRDNLKLKSLSVLEELPPLPKFSPGRKKITTKDDIEKKLKKAADHRAAANWAKHRGVGLKMLQRQRKARMHRMALEQSRHKLKRDIEEKLKGAETLKKENLQVKQERAKEHNKRVEMSRQKMDAEFREKVAEQRIKMQERIRKAEKRRKVQINGITEKCFLENMKVRENNFLQTMNAKNRSAEIEARLERGEARRRDYQQERGAKIRRLHSRRTPVKKQRKQADKAAKETPSEKETPSSPSEKETPSSPDNKSPENAPLSLPAASRPADPQCSRQQKAEEKYTGPVTPRALMPTRSYNRPSSRATDTVEVPDEEVVLPVESPLTKLTLPGLSSPQPETAEDALRPELTTARPAEPQPPAAAGPKKTSEKRKARNQRRRMRRKMSQTLRKASSEREDCIGIVHTAMLGDNPTEIELHRRQMQLSAEDHTPLDRYALLLGTPDSTLKHQVVTLVQNFTQLVMHVEKTHKMRGRIVSLKPADIKEFENTFLRRQRAIVEEYTKLPADENEDLSIFFIEHAAILDHLYILRLMGTTRTTFFNLTSLVLKKSTGARTVLAHSHKLRFFLDEISNEIEWIQRTGNVLTKDLRIMYQIVRQVLGTGLGPRDQILQSRFFELHRYAALLEISQKSNALVQLSMISEESRLEGGAALVAQLDFLQAIIGWNPGVFASKAFEAKGCAASVDPLMVEDLRKSDLAGCIELVKFVTQIPHDMGQFARVLKGVLDLILNLSRSNLSLTRNFLLHNPTLFSRDDFYRVFSTVLKRATDPPDQQTRKVCIQSAYKVSMLLGNLTVPPPGDQLPDDVFRIGPEDKPSLVELMLPLCKEKLQDAQEAIFPTLILASQFSVENARTIQKVVPLENLATHVQRSQLELLDTTAATAPGPEKEPSSFSLNVDAPAFVPKATTDVPQPERTDSLARPPALKLTEPPAPSNRASSVEPLVNPLLMPDTPEPAPVPRVRQMDYQANADLLRNTGYSMFQVTSPAPLGVDCRVFSPVVDGPATPLEPSPDNPASMRLRIPEEQWNHHIANLEALKLTLHEA